MREVGNLIGAKRAAAAGVLGPAEHPGLEEGAIENQLRPALEQIEQAYLALGSVKLVLLLDRHPRHPTAFGGQCVPGAGQSFLLHKELLARSVPFLLRHDRRRLHQALSRHVQFSLLFGFWTISSAAFFFRETFTAKTARPPVETAQAKTTATTDQ